MDFRRFRTEQLLHYCAFESSALKIRGGRAREQHPQQRTAQLTLIVSSRVEHLADILLDRVKPNLAMSGE